MIYCFFYGQSETSDLQISLALCPLFFSKGMHYFAYTVVAPVFSTLSYSSRSAVLFSAEKEQGEKSHSFNKMSSFHHKPRSQIPTVFRHSGSCLREV